MATTTKPIDWPKRLVAIRAALGNPERPGYPETQEAFARRLGIPKSTLCKWESGESRPSALCLRFVAPTLAALEADARE